MESVIESGNTGYFWGLVPGASTDVGDLPRAREKHSRDWIIEWTSIEIMDKSMFEELNG